jgi:hypothetical protein
MNMKLRTAAAAIIAVGLVASFAHASDATPPAKKHTATSKAANKKEHCDACDQIQALKQEMQSQIDALKQDLANKDSQLKQAQEAAAAAQASAAKAEAAASAQQQAVSDNAAAVNTLQTSVSDLKANQLSLTTTISDETSKIKKEMGAPNALHYKGITITPGGFLAAETIYRTKATGGDIPTAFSSLPYEGADAYSLSEFFGTARQSRITLQADGKTTWGSLRGYYEADFLGTGITSNNNQSNSYALRERILYAQAQTNSGWTFAGGQLWSLATEQKKGITSAPSDVTTPQTIDPNYVPGFVWTRQYGFRVVKSFNHGAVGFSVENPQLLYSAALSGDTPYAVLGSAGQNGGNYNAAISGLSGATTYVKNYTNQKVQVPAETITSTASVNIPSGTYSVVNGTVTIPVQNIPVSTTDSIALNLNPAVDTFLNPIISVINDINPACSIGGTDCISAPFIPIINTAPTISGTGSGNIVFDLGTNAVNGAQVTIPAVNNLPVTVTSTAAPTTSAIYVPVYNTVYANSNIANLSFNQAPDLLGKVALDPGWGHFEAFGIVGFAHETVYPGVTQNSVKYGGVADIMGFAGANPGTAVVPASTTNGYHVNSILLGGGGGSLRVPVIKDKLTVGFKGMYGLGIGRYGDSTLSDVTNDASGNLQPIKGGSGLITVEANPTPRLSLYLNYGGDYADRTDYGASALTLTDPKPYFCETGVTAATAATLCSASPSAAMIAAGGTWGPHFTATPANTAIGYGSRYANNSSCNTITAPGLNSGSVGYQPGGSCSANTRDVQEVTGGYWYDIYKGDRGRLRQGIQYGYAVREGWSGLNGIGAKGIDNMFWTTFRYYLP